MLYRHELNITRLSTCCLLIMFVSFSAHAQSADFTPYWKLQAGAVRLAPKINAGRISVGNQPLNGLELSADNVDTGALFVAYQFSPTLAVEVLLSEPIDITLDLAADLLPGSIPAVTLDVLPLTIAGKYSPHQLRWGPVQGFVGLGAVYLVDKNSKTTPEFNALSTAMFGDGNPRVNITNQWNAFWEAGVSYNIDEQWSMNATVINFHGSTSSNVDVAAGQRMEINIDYNPVIYAMTLGYQF